MRLISPVFEESGSIPKKYTCEGENINPPLLFKEVPPHAESLVLIMEDPDVPKAIRADGMYDHWILFNIPADILSISENAKKYPGLSGENTQGKLNYLGPCPPDRKHRYFFKLFALDAYLSLSEGVSKKELEKAMEKHILEKALLIGLYEKEIKDPNFR